MVGMTQAAKLVARFDSQAQLAREVGVRRSTVWMWVKRGRIPSRHWGAIAHAAARRGITITLQDLVA